MEIVYCNKCNEIIYDEIHNHQTDCKDILIEKINEYLETTDIISIKHFYNYLISKNN